MHRIVLSLSLGAGLLVMLRPAWQLHPQEAEEPYAGMRAEPWPEADRLFRSDPRWLGGDGASSVDLGHGRVLWLFGDSFIANSRAATRAQSTMVRNSVAIETGYDPSRASIKFYWKERRGKPASFASEEGKTWLWPLAGVRLGARLLLFYTRVRPHSRKDSLGFQNFGWAAFLVENPDDEPSAWAMRRIEAPANAWNVMVAPAVLAEGNFLYAFSPAEPKHDVYLVRWPLDAADHGDLSSPEWWCGLRQGWIAQQKVARRPAPVFEEGQMEFTVQWDAGRKKFLEVHSVGFGAAEIAIRWAERLEGPWPAPRAVYRPPESDRPDAFVYAAKGHPELSGGDLVVTYVANTMSSDFGVLVRDTTIYYPRFVRFRIPPR